MQSARLERLQLGGEKGGEVEGKKGEGCVRWVLMREARCVAKKQRVKEN